MIYFDNSATTPMAPEVIEEIVNHMNTQFANPSSRHALGLEAEKTVSLARQRVAKALFASPDEVYFTSGGTESDNIAILGAANIKKGKRIVTTQIEHPAVSKTMDYLEESGFEVIRVMPESDGNVRAEKIIDSVNENTCLVSVMHVNNETGAILPVDKLKPAISRIAPRALFHVDAVQSFGHIMFKSSLWGIDLASVSSHKIHGPKGVGALYIRKGVTIKQSVFGGGQEKNIRSGTENTTQIAGFGKACELLSARDAEKAAAVKNILKEGLLKISSASHNGGSENESPFILNISFEGIRSEIMLNALSARGIYVSSGSACASGHHTSPVLKAMNTPLADFAVRFSLSRYNTEEEALEVVQTVTEIEKGLRR